MSSLDLLTHRVNPQGNLAREMRHVSANEPNDTAKHYAQKLLAVHGTTIESLYSILDDGRIFSYKELIEHHPEIVDDRQQRQTDELDVELGLHEFVFWNVGRVHPVAMHDVYLCAKNELVTRPDNLVSLREIVHFGALVSPEAKNVHRKLNGPMSNEEIQRINDEAAEKFFKTLISGPDFPGLFSRFFHRHYKDQLLQYLGTLSYPGVSPSFHRYSSEEALVKGTWEGPQLMVPGSVGMEDVQALLVTTTDKKKVEKIMKSGFPENKIFRIGSAVNAYTKLWKNTFLQQGFGSPLDNYLFMNSALADMADFPFLNRAGEDSTKDLIAFKEMAELLPRPE